MSTTTKSGLKVIAGYDAPFNHFFGYVEDPLNNEDEDGEEVFIYHSMNDNDADFGGGFNDFSILKEKIEKAAGESLPDKFWESAAIKDMNQTRII